MVKRAQRTGHIGWKEFFFQEGQSKLRTHSLPEVPPNYLRTRPYHHYNSSFNLEPIYWTTAENARPKFFLQESFIKISGVYNERLLAPSFWFRKAVLVKLYNNYNYRIPYYRWGNPSWLVCQNGNYCFSSVHLRVSIRLIGEHSTNHQHWTQSH